jgi:hypothetical protein
MFVKKIASVLLVGLCILAAYRSPLLAEDPAAARTVAFLGVQLQNDNEGLEPTTDAERARMKEIERLFESKLQGSGRFKFVPVPPEMIKDIAAGRGLRLFEMRASSERPLRRHDTLGRALCPRQSNTSTTAG